MYIKSRGSPEQLLPAQCLLRRQNGTKRRRGYVYDRLFPRLEYEVLLCMLHCRALEVPQTRQYCAYIWSTPRLRCWSSAYIYPKASGLLFHLIPLLPPQLHLASACISCLHYPLLKPLMDPLLGNYLLAVNLPSFLLVNLPRLPVHCLFRNMPIEISFEAFPDRRWRS